jgi:phosphoenolpyruvate-protein phosphotransferase (PTS system enzyme I)
MGTAHPQTNTFVRGIGASPGVVIGKAFLVDRSKVRLPQRRIDSDRVETEVDRFQKALEESRKQLLDIKEKILDVEVRRHAFILDVHLMILDDEMLVQDTIDTIRKKKINAEWALDLTLENLDTAFQAIEDEYLKERRNDLRYVSSRLFRNLVGKKHDDLTKIKGNVIIVAHDLSPADTLQMNLKRASGFITEIGGKVSHTAILARSLGIPAVVGTDAATALINGGDLLIIDGATGDVVINPTDEVYRSYVERRRRIRLMEREALKYASLPAETRDGVRITLQANVEMVSEIPMAKLYGAEGVGLYRTEFLYLNRKTLPGEEDHFEIYRQLAEEIFPATATIRTLDVGGDKFLSNYSVGNETNPSMGLRAIRFCLKETEIFKTQLKGILRASAFGRLRILLPMISGVEEVRQVKAILEEVKKGLRKSKIAFDPKLQIGAMIEIPSASITADILAREVDFFSVGTNDLIQYALAIDRVNEHVSYLFEPLHPAILRIIRGVVLAARLYNIHVALCGEMAADPAHAMVLMGLGLQEFSMTPVSIPKVKKMLRQSKFEETRVMVEELLELSTTSEIEGHLRRWMLEKFPDDFSMAPLTDGKA